MGCGCNQNKPKAAAAVPPTQYKVRIINHSPTPVALVGKSSNKNYGPFKDGDRIMVDVVDYQAEPEKFVNL